MQASEDALPRLHKVETADPRRLRLHRIFLSSSTESINLLFDIVKEREEKRKKVEKSFLNFLKTVDIHKKICYTT